LALVCILMHAAPAHARQEPPDPPPAGPSGWTWSFDGHAFVGFNYQYRKFRDFHEVESQNWAMAAAARRIGRGRLRFTTMVTLEPFTIQALGSPQVFQTGETFEGAPLIDYQHPHDLVMGLSADYERPVGAVRVYAGAGLVDAPPLGPPAFMHRPSGRDNPQVPLSHHNMDATHITPGAVRAGLGGGAFRIDAAWFRGREPDETRTDFDVAAFDSWSVRSAWMRGPWHAQISAARLHEPEIFEREDVTRLTASLGYTGGTPDRPRSLLLAWGQNREIHGNLDAYLLEGVHAIDEARTVYGRAELVVKNLLDLGGFHPPQFRHPHRLSRVGALTAGYIHDFLRTRRGRVGVGGDVSSYRVPANLQESYGRPWSFHLFVRYRLPSAGSAAAHHQHVP
jgi:hypothetical protein